MIVTTPYTYHSQGGAFGIITGRYCSELVNVINVAKAKGYKLPTDYQLRCLDVLIKELKEVKVFQTYDLLYIYGYNSLDKYAQKEAFGSVLFSNTGELPRPDFEKFTLLNFIDPTSFELQIQRSPTRNNYPFTNELGWTSGKAGVDFGGLDTGWVAGVDGINWTQNNAGGFCYTHEYLPNAASVFGVQDGSVTRTTFYLLTNNASNAVVGRINGNNTNRTYVSAGGVSTGNGHHRLQRTGASASAYYRDGVQLGTSTGASATMTGTYSLWALGYSTNGVRSSCDTSPMSYCGLGSALTDAQVKHESDIFKNYREKLALII